MSLITLYRGKRGAGKTLTMVKDAYKYYLRGWKIYTNMYSIPFAERLEEKEILELADNDGFFNCVVMIDEIQTLIDSRRSMRKANVDFNYFLQQIRKRNVYLFATTQYSKRVDIGFREQLDILVTPRFIKRKNRKSLVDVTYTDLTVEEYEGYNVHRRLVYDPTIIFGLYDTEERITAVKTKNKDKE